jgi:hypothetical protein
LYFSAIEIEYQETKGVNNPNPFPKVETATIDALDKISNKAGLSGDFTGFFLNKYAKSISQKTENTKKFISNQIVTV